MIMMIVFNNNNINGNNINKNRTKYLFIKTIIKSNKNSFINIKITVYSHLNSSSSSPKIKTNVKFKMVD